MTSFTTTVQHYSPSLSANTLVSIIIELLYYLLAITRTYDKLMHNYYMIISNHSDSFYVFFSCGFVHMIDDINESIAALHSYYCGIIHYYIDSLMMR